ncbi:imidazole glycerol phosphate synthase subunit HisH [Candidatus Pelagibacter sp.]|nr:imidazole glycerol phosphate synthase subunit HisH [Candidatus Pelagibacter sp.]
MLGKKIKVGIIDLGINNIHSISNAYKKIGCNINIIRKKENLQKYDIVVLPGVGAYKTAMKKLSDLKIKNEIIKFVEKSSNNYLIGICLGMQLLFDESYEFGHSKGLGLIEGKVLPFDKKICKITPHMNWNTISIKNNSKLFNKFSKKNFYFVHSYFCKPKNQNEIVAQTNHNGYKFCSVVKKKNIIGLQFHPEKSSTIGIDLLKSITKLT